MPVCRDVAGCCARHPAACRPTNASSRGAFGAVEPWHNCTSAKVETPLWQFTTLAVAATGSTTLFAAMNKLVCRTGKVKCKKDAGLQHLLEAKAPGLSHNHLRPVRRSDRGVVITLRDPAARLQSGFAKRPFGANVWTLDPFGPMHTRPAPASFNRPDWNKTVFVHRDFPTCGLRNPAARPRPMPTLGPTPAASTAEADRAALHTTASSVPNEHVSRLRQ